MIQVMSEQISFQQRLTLVLPLLSKALVVEKEEQKIKNYKELGQKEIWGLKDLRGVVAKSSGSI